MTKLLRALLVLTAFAGFAGGAYAQVENDIDRPGGDYTSVTLPPGSTAGACLGLCEADGNCQAWTFVRAGVQAPNPRCWLKSSVPAAVANACCVSGVKPQAAAFEPNTDRPGGDYLNFNVPNNWVATACQALCDANGQCRAWTYVNAGVQGPAPRCWLKSSVPAKVSSNCCTSGVKP